MSATLRTLAAAIYLGLAAGAAAAPPEASSEEQIVQSSPGKPAAPIAVDVRLAAEPAAGVLLDVAITARASEVRELTLQAHAADPDALLVAARTVGAATGDGGRTWTVTVLPRGDEVAYLSVEIGGLLGGAHVARSLLVPVRVGGARRAVRSAATVAGTAPAERLVLLPVRETVRSQPD